VVTFAAPVSLIPVTAVRYTVPLPAAMSLLIASDQPI